MINALTLDFEDWYQVPFVNLPVRRWDSCISAIEKPTELIIQYLNKRRIKATIFVSGYIANRHPNLVHRLFKAGHEIESHGYWHELAYKQSPKSFEADIKRSITVIKKITGIRPYGYRSPLWSTNRFPDRSAKVLIKNGFVYDCSPFPTYSVLLGNIPEDKFIYKYKNSNLFQIPLSVFRILNINIPVTGGFYLRLYPLPVMAYLIRILNQKGIPALFYFHPWEVTFNYPKQKISILKKFIQYYRCGKILDRLDYLVSRFRFGSIRQAYPQISP